MLHCNPLSASQQNLEEILRATRNFSIVALVGTQRKSPVGLGIRSSKEFGCTTVEAGWARAPLSNKSAGVLCASRPPRDTYTRHGHHPRRCRERQWRHVSKEVFFDLFICCMYLPPKPQSASKRGGYQRTVEGLLGWFRLSEQRHRTAPVVLVDANDGVGFELRNGRYREVDMQYVSVSAAGARREHIAGKRLREIMEKHHMRATSAAAGGSTWFGDGGRPRSSIVCGLLKRSLFDALAHSDVWHLRYSSSTRAS